MWSWSGTTMQRLHRNNLIIYINVWTIILWVRTIILWVRTIILWVWINTFRVFENIRKKYGHSGTVMFNFNQTFLQKTHTAYFKSICTTCFKNESCDAWSLFLPVANDIRHVDFQETLLFVASFFQQVCFDDITFYTLWHMCRYKGSIKSLLPHSAVWRKNLWDVWLWVWWVQL